jgi:hypothetical protein
LHNRHIKTDGQFLRFLLFISYRLSFAFRADKRSLNTPIQAFKFWILSVFFFSIRYSSFIFYHFQFGFTVYPSGQAENPPMQDSFFYVFNFYFCRFAFLARSSFLPLFKERATTSHARRQTCALYSSRGGCNLRKKLLSLFFVSRLCLLTTLNPFRIALWADTWVCPYDAPPYSLRLYGSIKNIKSLGFYGNKHSCFLCFLLLPFVLEGGFKTRPYDMQIMNSVYFN